MRFPISEIFHSIQGEGVNRGKNYIFVRFAGCNLNCIWCDTKYSWHPKYLDYEMYTKEKLIETIKNFSRRHRCKRILFTGGEPFMFQDVMEYVMQQFPKYYFEVETNGSFETRLPFSQINVSYKLKNAKTRKYPLKILPAKNVDYKFVMKNEKDLGEVIEICNKYKLPKKNVYLMPEGIRKAALERKTKWLQKTSKKCGMQWTPRLHILLFGNRKGT